MGGHPFNIIVWDRESDAELNMLCHAIEKACMILCVVDAKCCELSLEKINYSLINMQALTASMIRMRIMKITLRRRIMMVEMMMMTMMMMMKMVMIMMILMMMCRSVFSGLST